MLVLVLAQANQIYAPYLLHKDGVVYDFYNANSGRSEQCAAPPHGPPPRAHAHPPLRRWPPAASLGPAWAASREVAAALFTFPYSSPRPAWFYPKILVLTPIACRLRSRVAAGRLHL